MKTTHFAVLLVLLVHLRSGQGSAGPKDTPSDAPASSQDNKKQQPAKILFVAPFGSQSHKNFYNGIIHAIAEDGHKVTVLTPFKTKPAKNNVQEVVFAQGDISSIMANSFTDGLLAATLNAMEQGPSLCFSALATQKTKSVLQKKYDLVFVSIFFNECFLGAIHSMKVPIVFVNPAEMFGPFTAKRMGNPTFASFSYNPMLNFEPPLSFSQRFISAMSEVMLDWTIGASFNRIDVTGQSLKLFPAGTPSTAEISANASLMMVNSVRLAEHPRPYMPNILLAGGLHCRPASPLPKEIEDWAARAGEPGFIYFSLGSAVSASHLHPGSVEVLVSALGSLPQRVLWKHDLTDLGIKLPPNVRLTKWAPQQDLLGDSRIRLFITHGGLLSMQEATYHGVPVLGLPVFGDQEGNVAGAEAQDWALKLSWDTLTEDGLREAITSIINDGSKRAKVLQWSALVRDVPLAPADEVRWWTNYLIRTGGAPHLRSPAAGLPWYQLYNTDVWLTMAGGALLLLWLLWTAVKMLWRCCCGKKKNKQTKQKQN